MESTAFKIEKKENYYLIKVLEDKFTAKVAPDLKAELVHLSNRGARNIIIDLSETNYCDSSGLSVILVANRICTEGKGCLVVANPQKAVSKLIEISQLGNVLNITPSLDEAVDFIFMDQLEKGIEGGIDENLN